jgi:hypothetical protein
MRRKRERKPKPKRKPKFAAKTCPFCGKTFTPSRAKQATCGAERCVYLRKRQMVRAKRGIVEHTWTCQVCGKTFTGAMHGGRPRVTCGDEECRKEADQRNKRERWRSGEAKAALTPKPAKKALPKARQAKVYTCIQCGKEFASLAPRGAKYCSPACSNEFWQLHYKAKREAARLERIGREPVKCPECGKEFIPNRASHTYCSDACAHARYNTERQTFESIRRTEKRWVNRAKQGLDITERFRVGEYPFSDPQCTPLEGLRILA